MSKNLPMAIEPSVRSDCDFHLITLPNQPANCLYFQDFVIETKTNTISESIAFFLGIDYDECIEYIGKDNFTHCHFPKTGFEGHYCRYRGITLEQLRILWDKAQNKCSDKYKPILAELILTQVQPLFNQQTIKHDNFKKEIDMNAITTNEPLTMSSQEMADLTETRHDNVKRTIETLAKKGLISFTQNEENSGAVGGRPKTIYLVNKRDSYVVVAQLSPEFTARLVDRWQELEKKVATPALPSSYKEALLALVAKEEQTEKLQLELKSKDEQIEADKSFTKLGKMMTLADGTVKIADYAIMLQNDHRLNIGQNRLFDWLREHGYLCKDEKQKNRPTQRAMELGLFAYTQRIITTNHGDELFKFTPRLTGKGQTYFIDKLIHDFSPRAA